MRQKIFGRRATRTFSTVSPVSDHLAAASQYIAMAQEIMGPDWVTPKRFRIGSARLLDDLLAVLSGAGHRETSGVGY